MGAKRGCLIGLAVVLNLFLVLVVVGAIQRWNEPGPYETPPGPYYLALGDSYAQGFQANGDLDDGFADLIPERLAARPGGARLSLVNFGCGGATVRAMLEHPGCAFPARREVAPPYPNESQVAAAERFIAAHPGQVRLITISIGANDVSVCAHAEDPVSCGFAVLATLGPSVTELLDRLRAAVGPDVPIIGTTYPNTMLGQWVHPPVNRDAATRSTALLAQAFNPTLRAAYEAAGATFVDVTEATGGYGPLGGDMTDTEAYGRIPTAVATVCELTRACDIGDTHPTDRGYSVIADLIIDAIPAELGGGGG